MALVGYARVSSVGQSLDVQLDKLKHCSKIFQEKKSGSSGKCPRLQPLQSKRVSLPP
jgi:DNA invertase Pin-like site-specific DNA recombinase